MLHVPEISSILFQIYCKFVLIFSHVFHILSDNVKSPGGHRVGGIEVVGALRLARTVLLGRQHQGALSWRCRSSFCRFSLKCWKLWWNVKLSDPWLFPIILKPVEDYRRILQQYPKMQVPEESAWEGLIRNDMLPDQLMLAHLLLLPQHLQEFILCRYMDHCSK